MEACKIEDPFSHSDVHVIEPARGLRLVDPFELWRWRELFVALIVRNSALVVVDG
jgi:hypothetical protein